jgi:hypothetical protein
MAHILSSACAMKPDDQLTDQDLAFLVPRAAAMPDAPGDLIRAAGNLAARASAGDVACAATRLLAAALRFDSWAGAPLAYGMRALPAETRHLLFSAMGRDIDLRITPAEPDFALAGQILGPDETGRVELTPYSGQGATASGPAQPRTASIDQLGEFRIDAVPSGSYRLTLCMGGDEIVLPPIEVGGRHG